MDVEISVIIPPEGEENIVRETIEKSLRRGDLIQIQLKSGRIFDGLMFMHLGGRLVNGDIAVYFPKHDQIRYSKISEIATIKRFRPL